MDVAPIEVLCALDGVFPSGVLSDEIEILLIGKKMLRNALLAQLLYKHAIPAPRHNHICIAGGRFKGRFSHYALKPLLHLPVAICSEF